MGELGRSQSFSLSCPMVHTVCWEFHGVWVLSLFWVMFLKKAWKGPPGVPQILERRTIRGDKASGRLLPESPPSAQFCGDPAGGFPRSERVKANLLDHCRSFGRVSLLVPELGFCFSYLRLSPSLSTEVPAPCPAPGVWTATVLPEYLPDLNFPFTIWVRLLFDLVPTAVALLKVTCNCEQVSLPTLDGSSWCEYSVDICRRDELSSVPRSLLTHASFRQHYLPSRSDTREGGQFPLPGNPLIFSGLYSFSSQFCPGPWAPIPACPEASSALSHLDLRVPPSPCPCYLFLPSASGPFS